MTLHQIPQTLPLVARLDLLQADQRGTDPAARHDQAIAGQIVHVNQGGRAEILSRLQRLQQGVVRVPATARAEHGAAARHRAERVLIEQTFHDPDTGRRQVVSCYAHAAGEVRLAGRFLPVLAVGLVGAIVVTFC